MQVSERFLPINSALENAPKFSSVVELFAWLGKTENNAANFGKAIVNHINSYPQLKQGFRFSINKHLDSLCLNFSIPFSSNVINNINMNTVYNKANGFQHILSGREKPNLYDRSPESLTLSFTSKSGNHLIIPSGEYTSLYEFCSGASKEEQQDFWGHTHKVCKDNSYDDKNKRFAAHTYSKGGQTEGHFHFRIESRI